MDSGYYAACTGLRTQTQALDVIANNLANLGSAGYRAQQTQFQSILAASHSGLLDPLNRAVNNFNVLGGTRLDFSNGNLQTTGNALDLALEGSGFFAVLSRAGIRYTRNGSFQQSSDGKLVTAQGDAVLGEQGPIALPAGEVSISADGTLSVAGALAGKLKIVDLQKAEVTPVGGSYYMIEKAISPRPVMTISV
jgi:flagellar basal-body rod protein FlgF